MGHYSNKPQQHLGELAAFLERVEQWAPKSYCEIGCKFGGTLWAVSRKMARGSLIVAVDLPHGQWGRSDSEQSLRDCITHLFNDGFRVQLFIGDSTDGAIRHHVQKLGPFDLLFIDANHTEAFVRADWANYGRSAKRVCFHDISAGPRKPGRLPIEVPKVWEEIKRDYAAEATFDEIRLDPTHNDNGIGILTWR
jgi:methyltransferase family protein